MGDALFNQEIKEENDGGSPLKDFSIIDPLGRICVYFRELRARLIEEISQSQAIFGAVAWLTDEHILNAMALVPNVSIVVQKEDFLRPDAEQKNDWRARLRASYGRLRSGYRYDHRLLAHMSYASDPSLEGVRCVGNYNREKKPAAPRMHNKFLVFCRSAVDSVQPDAQVFTPYAVWTGSFNFTKNAGKSFENAILIRDGAVAEAYYKEWEQIMALSEPLNWEADWCAPEWRIGS